MQYRSAEARLAAIVWLVAGLMWLALEAVSAVGYPGYSYARNYISDLGVPSDSPRHVVMNVNFIAHGILFLLAGTGLFRAVGAGRARRALLGLAIIYAIGSVLIGVFHGSAQADADGTAGLHFFGAALAIGGGNAALIVAGLTARRLGLPDGYRTASAIIGTLGLASILALQAGNPFGLTGVWERGAVYSITLWEIATGVALLVSKRRQTTAPSGSAERATSQPTR